MLYFGAAGVIWALDRLARADAIAPPDEFSQVVAELEARNTALIEPWGHGVNGLLMGNSGIRLLHYRRSVDRGATDTAAAVADALAAGIAANTGHPSLELLWGSPGTMHAALTMHEWTGEARWAALFRADAAALWRALLPIDEAPCRMWTQDLWGRKQKMTGAGHGFAGNASALIRGRALPAGELGGMGGRHHRDGARHGAARRSARQLDSRSATGAHAAQDGRAVVPRRAGNGDEPGRPARCAPRRICWPPRPN